MNILLPVFFIIISAWIPPSASAQELNSENESVYYNLALDDYNLQEYESAIENLEKALEINPDFPEAHYLLGVIYYEFDFFEDASAAFENAVASDHAGRYFPLAEKYFEKIDEKTGPKNLYMNGYAGYNYDSNVNQLPAAAAAAATSDKGDAYYMLGVYGIYIPGKTGGKLNLWGSLYNYTYSKYSRLNNQSLNLGLDAVLADSKPVVFSARVDYAKGYMNNLPYSEISELNPQLQIEESGNAAALVSFGYKSKYYAGSYAYLKGYGDYYSLGQVFYFDEKKGYLRFSYDAGKETASELPGSQFSYSYYYRPTPQTITDETVNVYSDYFYCYSYNYQQVSAEASVPVTGSFSAFFKVLRSRHTYRRSDYWYKPPAESWFLDGSVWKKYINGQYVAVPGASGPVTVFQTKKREDDIYEFSFNLEQDITSAISLYLNYSLETNISNLGRNDYYDYNFSRYFYSATVRFAF